jgi:hypothetical protein
VRTFEVIRDGQRVGEGIEWSEPKEDGFRVDVWIHDRTGAGYLEAYPLMADCEAAFRNTGEIIRYLPEPLGRTTAGEAVYVSDTERPPPVRQPCPTHGTRLYCADCDGCKDWYERDSEPPPNEPRVVEIPEALRDKTAVEVLRDPPTMLPRKKPSERVAEIVANGRAMCALAAVSADDQDLKIHAICLYLDERLGVG